MPVIAAVRRAQEFGPDSGNGDGRREGGGVVIARATDQRSLMAFEEVSDVIIGKRALLPPRTWRQPDDIDLRDELLCRVRTVREPPRSFRGQLKRACYIALQAWRRSNGSSVSWKGPTQDHRLVGKDIFINQMRGLLRGRRIELLRESRVNKPTNFKRRSAEEEEATKLHDATNKIKLREISNWNADNLVGTCTW